MDDFNKSLEYHPSNTDALFGRAVMYIEEQKYMEALMDFHKMDTLRANHYAVYYNISLCYDEWKQFVLQWKGMLSKDIRIVTQLITGHSLINKSSAEMMILENINAMWLV